MDVLYQGLIGRIIFLLSPSTPPNGGIGPVNLDGDGGGAKFPFFYGLSFVFTNILYVCPSPRTQQEVTSTGASLSELRVYQFHRGSLSLSLRVVFFGET